MITRKFVEMTRRKGIKWEKSMCNGASREGGKHSRETETKWKAKDTVADSLMSEMWKIAARCNWLQLPDSAPPDPKPEQEKPCPNSSYPSTSPCISGRLRIVELSPSPSRWGNWQRRWGIFPFAEGVSPALVHHRIWHSYFFQKDKMCVALKRTQH